MKYRGLNENDMIRSLKFLKQIQLDDYDASVFSNDFSWESLEINIELNKLFKFSSDYQNLDVYNYFNRKEPHLVIYNIRMIIAPQFNIGIQNTEIFNYIPTDIISTKVNFKNPIILGNLLLPELKNDLLFITNLVPLEELKAQEPLLNNKATQIEISVDGLERIDIIKVQQYIQGTVRAAVLEKINSFTKILIDKFF